ncbi:MAG: TonB-dependent receptor [Sphingomonadaceae bacterium]|uniref:TonB-dependent receptor n=1 Tax=Thermaurantiacus sp. TaxID=2820283 RepID=UPI00298F1DFD|nr:TonB-dependent receptor [Thermaurantiacus sp.]MCS6986018.1 TonB-dependent receptor [Sphingomonadaceae bacterium]MDW8414766.1 TonB-dependent receptor [Thermaurantiacus sp.]
MTPRGASPGASAWGVRAFAGGVRAGVALMALPAAVAAAQTAGETEPSFAEIIVSARLQAETLQDVPVTVSVLGGEDLRRYNYTQVAQVVSRVPSLNVQVGGSGSGAQLSLRGIGSSNISAAFDSAVALDFDGVLISTMRMLQAGFFDVGQIEVLRGPQSLYFGKSASAGVLSIKSANPTPRWEAGLFGSYEFDEKGWLVGGHVAGPLTDTLGIRLAGQFNDIREFQRMQPGTPAVNQTRGLKYAMGRLTVQWEPDPSLLANLKVQYLRHENDGAIGTAEVFCGKNGRADPIVVLQQAIAVPAGYDCRAFDQRYFLPDAAIPLAPGVPLPSKAAERNGVPFGETDLFMARLRLDARLSDRLLLTSISGYVNLDATDFDAYSYGGVGPAFSPIPAPSPPFPPGSTLPVGAIAPALGAVNAPGIPLGLGTSDPTNKLTQFSQELRLTSELPSPVNFMLGAYYEWRKFTFDTAQNAVNISLIGPDPDRPLLGGGIARGTGWTYDYNKIHVTKTEAFSVFGSLTWDLSDTWQLSGGLRFTDERKVQTISVPFVNNRLAYVPAPGAPGFFVPSPAFLRSGFFSGPIEFEDSNWSPEVTLRHQPQPDLTLFASFKTGFKSGGIDNSALPTNALLGLGSPDPNVVEATKEALTFDSERAIGGEVGAKTQLFDRALTLNGTVFYYVFKDLQVQNFNSIQIQFVTSNAGEVTTKGLDLFAGWNTPIPGLVVSSNMTLLGAKYTAPFVQPGDDGIPGTADDVDLEGRRASQSPRVSGNVAADWAIPLGQRLRLNLGANVAFNSGYLTDENTLNDDFFQKRFATLDANVAIGDAEGRWQIALIGVNVTDRIYVITSGPRPFLAPGTGLLPRGDDIIVTQNRGRQVFLEGRLRF